jgi:Phage integrase family.
LPPQPQRTASWGFPQPPFGSRRRSSFPRARRVRTRRIRHEFRRIAKSAGIGLQFLDLRRSAVVYLAEADCTIPQISAITGHQLDRTTRILETYLPRTAPMARAPIHKLELYRKRAELEF